MITVNGVRQPPYGVRFLMRAAAELKAMGNSWKVIGDKLCRHPRNVRRWREKYPAVWDELWAKAMAGMIRRACANPLKDLTGMFAGKGEIDRFRMLQLLSGRFYEVLIRQLQFQRGAMPMEPTDEPEAETLEEAKALAELCKSALPAELPEPPALLDIEPPVDLDTLELTAGGIGLSVEEEAKM